MKIPLPEVRVENNPTIHHVKTQSIFFDLVAKGIKRTELRKNDRDYRQGDMLLQYEITPDSREFVNPSFSGRIALAIIDRVIADTPGAERDYVLLVLGNIYNMHVSEED